MKDYKIVMVGVILVSALGGGVEAAVIFSEDFSSAILRPNAVGYLGGWFGSAVGFQTWNGPGEAVIGGGALTVSTTSTIRSAGIVLSPTLFPSAGSYTVSFDVTSYVGDGNDSGLVRVWGGRGYDLFSSGNALILDTLTAQFNPVGTASSSLLGSALFIVSGTGQQFSFNYNGTDAVALFFGASTGGSPFPLVTFDNISVSTVLVPEASTGALVGLLGVATAVNILRRRRA
jgi:hypothetical protein